jgi:Cu(I)/Ag(I) efflux system membrane fusion protein
VLAVLALAALIYRSELVDWFSSSASNSSTGAPVPHEEPENDVDRYTCSMHPSVHQDKPGKCPICGMELVPVTKAQQRESVVTIQPARQQLIGVRTDQVREGRFVRTLRAVGRVAYDEAKLSEVSLRVSGFVVKLYATDTGQRVTRGQPLFTVYSPELYNAQQNYLLATRDQSSFSGSNTALARSARQRLRLLNVSDAQIAQLDKRGEPLENVTFSAPEAGFIIEKNVVEGAAVEPGMRLYRIAALDKVWIEADVYEADLASVSLGQSASVTLDYLPGRVYQARVAFVYPYLNTEARTGRVRLSLENKQLELRPGMYANVQLQSDLGDRLQVPASAIVYTGPRRLVFVDLGEGRFRPQPVHVGAESDGMYEVLSGLQAGDRVATSGVFLIAAEARIRTAATYWEATESGAIGEGAAEQRPAPVLDAPRSEMDTHIEHYSCPMHPEVVSSTPSKCPKCGMDLVPSRAAAPQ